MFKKTISGLEDMFRDDSDIPVGSVILVTGVEGALKSSFVFNMMSNSLAIDNNHGLYATLEEIEESHIRNMSSLGIKKLDSLHIFDYKDIRIEWDNEEPDIFKITEDMITYYKEKYNNLSIFALDSLNALCSLSNQSNLRKKMYHFFSFLRSNNLTSFIIMETNPEEKNSFSCNTGYSQHPENFLADGILELGIVENKENVKRYIQIRKMRGSNHSMEKHQIIISKEGLNILGHVY